MLQDDWEEVTMDLLKDAWKAYNAKLPGGMPAEEVFAQRWLEAIRQAQGKRPSSPDGSAPLNL